MNPKKLEGIKNWATPNNLTEIQKFLRFTGYYRYFVPNYSQIAWLLLHLMKKTTPWEWTNVQQLAFDLLKALMCEAPVLIQPNFEKKFFLQVDASAYSMGAVLSQEGKITTPSLEKRCKPALHPIAFYLATFTPTEQNDHIYNRELLAVMKALYHWRPYLAWCYIYGLCLPLGTDLLTDKWVSVRNASGLAWGPHYAYYFAFSLLITTF
jgi:hypothetical protein